MSEVSARAVRHRRAILSSAVFGAAILVSTFPSTVASASPVQIGLPEQAAQLAIGVGLGQGSVGPQVKVLQNALGAAGFRIPGGADGIFGPATTAALQQYQAAKNLPATGVVDTATLAVLGGAPAPAAPAAPAAAPAPAAAAATGDLALGAQGDPVKALQQALTAAGVPVRGGADGVFGAATRTAVRNFQKWNGLDVTGVADAATMAKLQPAPAATPAAAANPYVGLTLGAQGDLVRSLQKALIASGVGVRGGADGAFGAATRKALTTFQTVNGLSTSGSVDDVTAARLGLGVAAAPAGSPASSGNAYVGLKLGAQGDRVKELQRALLNTGLAVRGGADGSFGLATQTALKSFQKVNGGEQTGVVSERDASVLGLGSNGSSQPQGVTGGVGYPVFGERGSRVTKLQQSLLSAGIKVPGGADGAFGSGTAGAIMEYQRREGLPVTGKVDDQTAGKLGQAPAAPPVPPSAAGITLAAFPVQGHCWFGDTWHAPRGGGRLHEGVDVIAKTGQQLYAVVDGTITKQYWDQPGARTGNGLRLAQSNGTYFTYLHLSAFAEGIGVGVPVKAGQLLGYVGSTGNSVTAHLHFEIHPYGGAGVNPYPLLKAIDACGVTAPRV